MKKRFLVPVLCAVALSTTACGSNASSSKTESTTEATTAAADATTAEETTTVEETTAAEAASEAIPMGQAAKIGEWNITVNNMQIVDNIPDGYGSFSPDAGNKYLLVSLSASNEGKKADSFLPSFSMGDDTSVKVIYGDGYEFTQTNLLGYSKSMIDSTINPLSSKEGDIAFEIPDSVATATDPIILQFSNGNEKIKFAIR